MSIRHALSRRLRDPRSQQTDKGWAGRSLEASIARAMLIGMATLHGVTGLAVLFSLGREPAALALAAAHVAMIATAFAVLRAGRGQLGLVLGSWALFVADWTLAPTPESTLLFAACWLCNLADTLPVMLLRGRTSWQVPLAAAVVLPLSMLLLRPEWASVARSNDPCPVA